MHHKSIRTTKRAAYNRAWRLTQCGFMCLSLLAPPLLACGPDFPLQLTQDRQANLQFLPQTAFSHQLQSLAQPLPWQYQAPPAPKEYLWDEKQQRYLSQTRAFEHNELPPAELALVNSLRDAPTPIDAEQRAAQLKHALPQALIWYTLGATAFESKDYERAKRYFHQLLELPEQERSSRSLWALYSLSRIELILSKTATDDAHLLQADAYLHQLQTAVRQGAADPLRLGLASLGEQAYILLHLGLAQAKHTGQRRADAREPGLPIPSTPGVLDRVIALYATQLAQGDSSGYDSLLMLSRNLMSLELSELQGLLTQANVQQLLIAYWQSSGNEFAYNGQLSALGHKVADILNLLPQDGLTLEYGDKLAAIYYQLGDYASAKRLLALATPTGLSWWLTAKIELQQGDRVKAAAAYAQAVRYFPKLPNTPDNPLDANKSQAYETPDDEVQVSEIQASEAQDKALATFCRISAEQGVLSLERGEYLAALAQLLASGDEYWQDIAYVAERVLTSAELTSFVDTQVPYRAFDYPQDSDWYDNIEPINNRLRYLLGRRLLREGALDSAPRYFPHPQRQASAQRYSQALTTAKRSTGIDSATAYWHAAELARHQGMELLGFELAPDYAIYQGMFDLSSWFDATPSTDNLTDKERQRVNASQAFPDKRFHYRYTAAELANKAADNVPHNSQAYAALLCQASGFVLRRDPIIARRYYQKYVANGPYVAWAERFGLQCQQPDFTGAAARERANNIAKWQALYHQFKKPVAYGALVIALIAAVIGLGRRARAAKRGNA
ncbi:MAG: hypothetical protein ACRC22_06810 [Shewanella sp.]